MIQKCSLDEFMAFPLRNKESQYKTWHNRSFIMQMSDVWNEADRYVKMHDAGMDISTQTEVFMDVCDIALADPKLSKGAFFELREAQWELLNYVLWGNPFNSTSKGAMSWFDQWMYDINWDLA